MDDASDCISTDVAFVTFASVVVAALFVSFAAVITVVVVGVAGFVGEFFPPFPCYLSPLLFFVGVVPRFRVVLRAGCC